MKKHVLIVDDEANIRDLLAEVLGLHGYRVTAVASAIAAEQALTDDRPDVIISDLQLDESDGLQMIERLKILAPTAPILLLTGVFFEPHVVRDILGKTVDAYLFKTASLHEILAAVDRLTGIRPDV